MLGLILVWIGLGAPASAQTCANGQPCGKECIPWEQLCKVEARPDSGETRWQIPWELLNAEAVRAGIFVAIYGLLVVVARQQSVGPREV